MQVVWGTFRKVVGRTWPLRGCVFEHFFCKKKIYFFMSLVIKTKKNQTVFRSCHQWPEFERKFWFFGRQVYEKAPKKPELMANVTIFVPHHTISIVGVSLLQLYQLNSRKNLTLLLDVLKTWAQPPQNFFGFPPYQRFSSNSICDFPKSQAWERCFWP